MIEEHTSSETDPFRRGREFGAARRRAVANTVAAYQRLFAEAHGLASDDLRRLGIAAGRWIEAGRPAALQELRGIADGAAVDVKVLLAINARTEILGGIGAPECSVLGVGADPASGEPVLAQNWDWHPSADGSLVLWTVRGGDGAWFATLTEAGILGKIGVNGRGLGVCLNMLGLAEDGGPLRGLPIHVVLRTILAECGTVEEARRLVEGQRYSASSAITVADAGGTLATFEVSPRGVGVVEPPDGAIHHTNHFLAGIGDAVDTVARDWPGSALRLAELRDRVPPAGGYDAEAIKEVLRSHRGAPSSVCSHDAENPSYVDRQQTMASVLIRPRDRSLEISEGPPCAAPYVAYRPSG